MTRRSRNSRPMRASMTRIHSVMNIGLRSLTPRFAYRGDRIQLRSLAVCGASIFVAACGGGGASSGGSVTVPGAPTIGAAIAGDGQATISFSAPASDGGATISGYTATCSVSGTSKSGSGTSSPITVSGLTNGTTYSCSVKATNSAGASAASAAVSVTPVAQIASNSVAQLMITADLLSNITKVSCALSDGSTATCYDFETSEIPKSDTPGPWCPTSAATPGGYIQDTSDIGGDGSLQRVTVAWLQTLDARMGWSIVNADGTVNVTTNAQLTTDGTQETGNWTYAMAQSSGITNHCLQGTPNTHTQTILIPVTPVALSSAASGINDTPGGSLGIALNGILYFPPEPTARIATYHNVAPIDPDGGHTGFGFDYHYHRAWKVTGVPDSVTQIYGFMFDGYPIYDALEPDGSTPAGLDSCQGHTTTALGYHYHASDSYPYITTCLHGAHATGMGNG